MSNPNANPNDEWAAYTPKPSEYDEWGQPQQDMPTQQFPAQSWEQQQWSQPAYAPAPDPQEPKSSNRVLYIIIGVLAVALLAVLGAFAVWSFSGSSSGSKEPVTSTVVETSTRAPGGAATDGAKPSAAPSSAKPDADRKDRTFGVGVPETSVTTEGFARAVGDDFRAYYAEHGKTPTSLRSLSPKTGQYYMMSCSPAQGGFRCTGGNNASVFISEQ